MMRPLLEQACSRGDIRLLDLHAGRFLEKIAGRGKELPELLLAATLVSAATGNGHVCLPLDQVAETGTVPDPALIPEPEPWRTSLLASSVVGRPGETAPLILDERNRLYLYRFFACEELIGRELRKRTAAIMPVDQDRAGKLLEHLFPGQEKKNHQQLAAALALLKQLLVISGGPGTGKTFTVARILALIQALQKENPLRIGLAAPTGKAAARLEESIRKAKLSLPVELARPVPEQAQTLHRLLGYRPMADDFLYTATNPLHLDLLVIDEASMVDVVMMAAVLRALPGASRLILLGDRNQLASVEAGSLFADLCGSGETAWSAELCRQLSGLTGQQGFPQQNSSAPSMGDAVIQLETSYRFQTGSGIHSLAEAVNSGSMARVNTVLAADFPDLETVTHTGSRRRQWLQKRILDGLLPVMKASSPEEAYAAMDRFRLLCGLRNGPAGVEGMNMLAEQTLRQAGLLTGANEWYRGKPIIIRKNRFDIQLFNGDIGILWPDEDDALQAWFKRSDNSLHPITPSLLPRHDTAYAITIHKAQGSEFDEVLLLLPEEENRVLSRELVYTGISRARSRLVLCCTPAILSAAVNRKTRRHSGLKEKLNLVQP